MGIFDIFRKNKPAEEHDPAEDYDRTPSQDITINVTEEYIEINGKQVVLPVKMEELFDMFSAAQKHTFGKIDIDFLTKEDNDFINESVSEQRANFTWNDLGLYAYTNEGRYADCLMVMLRPSTDGSDPEHYPQNMFGGTLTISGAHWFEFLKSVKPEYSNSSNKHRTLGRYVIYGEFTEREFKDKKRTDKHYSHIQISLRS
ncbi:MAG: hypothetical protein IJZ47_13050 [Oscillospiraceae bacterium]|nr:hypothetical protein [Oscillospiraceae bacterium]